MFSILFYNFKIKTKVIHAGFMLSYASARIEDWISSEKVRHLRLFSITPARSEFIMNSSDAAQRNS